MILTGGRSREVAQARSRSLQKIFDEQDRLGWTSTRLEVVSGISRSTISRARLGHRTLTIEQVEILAESLGLEVCLLPISRKGKSHGTSP